MLIWYALRLERVKNLFWFYYYYFLISHLNSTVFRNCVLALFAATFTLSVPAHFFFLYKRHTRPEHPVLLLLFFFCPCVLLVSWNIFLFFFSSLPRRSIQYCGLFFWSITWSRFYACQIVQVDFRRTEWHSNILFIFPSLVCLFSFFFFLIYLRCVQPTQSQMLPWIIIPSLFCLTPSIPCRLLRGKFKEEEEKKS